jgi:phenylacetyl-CoA:acceptor oxidoreductase subunit 1
MTAYAMVVDVDRCVGCQTCTAACKQTNATAAGVQWRRVLDFEAGVFPDVRRTFLPVGCMHCADAPCVKVCPTTATRKRPDGIVSIDYQLCIGCAYCIMSCPYQAREMLRKELTAYGGAAMSNEKQRAQPERYAVAQKCTFCSDRIDYGRKHNLVPGIDPEATPACVNACISNALVFGDLDDPGSRVSTLLQSGKYFRMHEALDTRPNLYYLWDNQP